MRVVTNGVFAVPLIPECKLYSIENWANQNQLTITNVSISDTHYEYYIPYRNSYDRIIRGLAADFHEMLDDAGIAPLNKKGITWDTVEPTAKDFIIRWAESEETIPIQKKYCHSGFYFAYMLVHLVTDAIFFDVEDLPKLPDILNKKYNLSLTTEFPELPPEFYNNTIPYWVIDELYKTNKDLANKIDNFCERDTEKSKKFKIVKL